MNARRNISARARKRHVADLDGLLASAVSVASRGGENAPLPKAHARQIDRDLSRLWQHRARTRRVAAHCRGTRGFASFRGQFGWSWLRGQTLEIAGNLWATRFRYL